MLHDDRQDDLFAHIHVRGHPRWRHGKWERVRPHIRRYRVPPRVIVLIIR